MKAPACAQSWMAEAADDGRLTDEQVASFRRHVAHCAICAVGVRNASRLSDLMRALPEPALDEFQHHRQRQQLLARAGNPDFRSVRPKRVWPPLAVALSIALLGVGAWRLGTRGGAAFAEPPRYEVTALDGASWTKVEIGASARVTLDRGSAAFHVHKLSGGQKFYVTLPDGEIEVRGTRFVVDVQGGHTQYVVVMEGKVALRHAGGEERLLLAGERWDAPAERASGASREIAGAAGPPPQAVGERIESSPPEGARLRSAPRGKQRATAMLAPAAGAPPPAVAPQPRARPSETPNLFARGVHAFRAGRYVEAESFWRLFETEHPGDPRVEDIAFLRAVGRARAGDAPGAAALARAYLARFPEGMRRKEAEALTHQGDGGPTEAQ